MINSLKGEIKWKVNFVLFTLCSANASLDSKSTNDKVMVERHWTKAIFYSIHFHFSIKQLAGNDNDGVLSRNQRSTRGCRRSHDESWRPGSEGAQREIQQDRWGKGRNVATATDEVTTKTIQPASFITSCRVTSCFCPQASVSRSKQILQEPEHTNTHKDAHTGGRSKTHGTVQGYTHMPATSKDAHTSPSGKFDKHTKKRNYI